MTQIWLLAHALMAQGNIDGPAMGMIWDANGAALRRVAGVPGSAVITSKLESPVPFQSAVSAGGRAFGLTGDGLVYRFDAATSWTRLPVPEGAIGVTPSPNGEAVAVLYRGGEVRILTAYAPAREVRLSAEPSSLALNAEGSLLLAADSSQLTVVNAAGNRWTIDLGATIRDIAFTGRGADLLVAASSGLWLVPDAGGPGDKRLLWAGEAAFVASASAGRIALVAAKGRSAIAIVDLETGSSSDIETPSAPAALSRMGAADVFRFTAAGAETAWMLDLGRSEPRILFLPAIGVEE